jgi:hypothetical protein
MTNKKMYKKPYTIHETEILLNKDKLKVILDRKGMEFIELHRKVSDKYGLDITYKGFMSLLGNRSTWKLLYAYAIADVLLIDIKDVFDIVAVDVEKVKKEKAEWKKQYQNKE